MLRILGKAASINVRKVLWTCAELGLAFEREDWGILERRLDKSGAFAAGGRFSLADVVLGLSVNRWRMTPMARPDYPAVDAYFGRLAARATTRPGFAGYCANGMP